MNFSYEEIYSMFGQYDTFVTLEFNFNSEEYKSYGLRLMGTFLYELEERKELEEAINAKDIPRTERKIRFKPSMLEKLSTEQKVDLDKNGILCSNIIAISSSNLPRTNRFKVQGKKEFQNVMHIKAPEMDGWEELNRMQFGFLNSRYSKGQPLAPQEYLQYWGLRKHLNINLNSEDYINNILNGDKKVIDKVRFYELQAKYHELNIEKKDIKEFARLIVEEIKFKNKIIEDEIKRSTKKISLISENYGSEIECLKKICRGFYEKIILFGEKLIYLDFKRFVHIYARHVSETRIGERFADNKTVFQYKFEDIICLIEMVMESINNEVQEHFKNNPEEIFRRMGKRSVYLDGHYYRIKIEPSGQIKDFHPYNDDKNTGAN